MSLQRSIVNNSLHFVVNDRVKTPIPVLFIFSKCGSFSRQYHHYRCTVAGKVINAAIMDTRRLNSANLLHFFVRNSLLDNFLQKSVLSCTWLPVVYNLRRDFTKIVFFIIFLVSFRLGYDQ